MTDLPEPPEVDWSGIILDLRRFGSSDEQTSVALDVSRHFLKAAREGKKFNVCSTY